MKNNSRIKFNPGTKEIEIEGNEEFVKTYFDKLQAMLSGPTKERVKRAPVVKTAPAEKAEKKPNVKVSPVPKAPKTPKALKARPPQKVKKATKKEPRVKRVTNIDKIVSLIQGSAEGITTSALKEKTGLVESQIWPIIASAKKKGKIKQAKRGVYVAV